MKLVISIVQDEDAHKLIDELMGGNFSVTKLATTGGFLKAGNTTLLVGVDNEKVQDVIDIIEKTCKSRKQIATSPAPIGASNGVYVPFPLEVQVGGATVFVVDVETFVKV